MSTLITVLGGIVVAGVGAWIGAAINRRNTRAQPRVIPTSMRLSTDVIPSGSVVEPNSDLLAKCTEHPFLDSPQFLGAVKVEELTYVDYLTRTLTNVQDQVRVQLPAIAKRAQQLQVRLAADDFEGVVRAWTQASDQLWNYAEGGYIRDEYRLDGSASEGHYQTVAETLATLEQSRSNPEIGKDSNGTSWVRYPGFVVTLIFKPRNLSGRAGAASHELAERMAVAFACQRKPDLSCVFNFLVGIEREAAKLEALAQKIEGELTRLTRLSVTTLISNTGGTPVSISKQVCDVTLFVDGLTYKVSEEEKSVSRQHRGNAELEMILVDDEGYPSPPLVVETGGTRTITAVYPVPLSKEQLTDGGTMHELIRSVLRSERLWRLKIDAVLQSNSAQPVFSRKMNFGDIHASDAEVGRDRRAKTKRQEELLKQRVALQESELSAARAELNTLMARVDAQATAYTDLLEHYEALRAQQQELDSRSLSDGKREPAMESGGAPSESHDGPDGTAA